MIYATFSFTVFHVFFFKFLFIEKITNKKVYWYWYHNIDPKKYRFSYWIWKICYRSSLVGVFSLSLRRFDIRPVSLGGWTFSISAKFTDGLETHDAAKNYRWSQCSLNVGLLPGGKTRKVADDTQSRVLRVASVRGWGSVSGRCTVCMSLSRRIWSELTWAVVRFGCPL